ncbi:MAG: CARDB domain-containing protein [Pseudomonadota bacterium]
MAAVDYEAESAALTGGAGTASDHTGYSGTGFAGGFTDANKGLSQASFQVNAPSAGAYTVALRYANGTGVGRSLSLYINGAKLKQTSLSATANWDTWGTQAETVTLVSGNNTIAYKYDLSDNGNVNLDKLSVTASAGVNLAIGKTVAANGSNGSANYGPANVNDGNTGTYWEGVSNAFPNTVTVNLGSTMSIGQVVVKLPSNWGSRSQTFAVLGSTDNTNWSTLAASASYAFAPATANAVSVNLGTASARYVRLSFAANSGAPAGQVAEMEIYSGGGSVTPPPVLPDLIVTSLSWTPTNPIGGNEVTFSATVRNQGTVATPAGTKLGVAFFVNGTQVNWSDTFTSSLPAGAVTVVTANAGSAAKATWTATPSTAGAHTIKASVNDQQLISENNTTNNSLTATMAVAAPPPPAALANGLYRIRNFWQTTQYLYEANGKVMYGSPAASSLSSQWALVDQGGKKLMWNAETGNSITLAGVSSSADSLTTAYNAGSNSALWTVAGGSNSGYYTIGSVAQPSWYVTMEGLKGFAQCYGITPTWGSPQWAFEYIGPVPPKPVAKPDLVVTDIVWSPAKPTLGQAVTFSATVKNQGDGATPAGISHKVSFAVDGNTVTWSDQNTSALAPGASVTLTANAGAGGATWAMAAASQVITATVNEQNLIVESNAANNTFSKILSNASFGASLPYTSYEAEAATYTGALISGSRTWGTLSSEATGRSAVQLSAVGQYVQFNLTSAARGLVVRYSIPNTANGAAYNAGLSVYVNNVKKQDLVLTNKYSWLYGLWGTEGGEKRWSRNPAATPANPHRFFDEAALILDASYPAGTTIKLVRESANLNFGSTQTITVDFLEAEPIPDALIKPSNYRSIAEFGAVANDGADDTTALNNAIAAVKASGGASAGVWIPVGTFHFNTGSPGPGYNGQGTRIYLDSGVSLKGSGIWWSVLEGAFAGIYTKGGNVTIADLKINSYDLIRDDANGVSGIEGNLSNSTVRNVWIEHAKVGVWATQSFSQAGIVNNATITGNRFRNIWADGLNLHYGTSNSVVSNNSIRNTGDDGMAMWSDTFLNTGNTFEFNTVQLPGLANGIAIYGGKDNTVKSNLIVDTIDNGAGISFGTNFNPPSLTGTLNITGNMLIRTGSYHHDYMYNVGAIWGLWLNSSGLLNNPTITVSNNQIQDSTYSGIFIEEPSTGAAMIFSGNQITNAGTYGVEVRASAAGTATFSNTAVTGAPLGNLKNNSPNFTVVGW